MNDTLAENLPATAKKGTGSTKTPSREFSPDKERFTMASMQTLERWNIDHLHMLNIIGKKLSVGENKTLIRILKDYVRKIDLKLGGVTGLGHCSSLLLALNLEPTWKISNTEEVLINSFKHCSKLHSLNMSSTKIIVGVKFLSDSLKHLKNLQILSLKSNHIASDGAIAIGKSLKHCTNLQILDLEFNDIGSEGSIALAASFRNCHNLQTLNLASNGIGTEGAKALADCLKHCPGLQTLNLRSNSIGDGAMALADGLKHCPHLQTLNLERNSIGADGAKALADGLKHCPELQTLNLGSNRIGDDGAKALADGLKHYADLQILNLKWNNIGADGAKALPDGLKHCLDLQIQHFPTFQSRKVSEHSMDSQFAIKKKRYTSKSLPVDPHRPKKLHYPDFTHRMRSPQTSSMDSQRKRHTSKSLPVHTYHCTYSFPSAFSFDDQFLYNIP